MRRKSRLKLMVLLVVIGFLFAFLAPVIYVGPRILAGGCSSTGECGGYPLYGSVTYRLFDVGGVWSESQFNEGVPGSVHCYYTVAV